MDCPFCDEKMVFGHIWIEASEGGCLNWQEGAQVRKGWFSKKVDETLLCPGLLSPPPVVQAFRCSDCGAILTDFSQSN